MCQIKVITHRVRGKLLKLFSQYSPHSITVNHAKERVRINGSGRRNGIADCLDELRSHRAGVIEDARNLAKDLLQLEKVIKTIEITMADEQVVRCPLCATGRVEHEDGALNHGGTGNPINSSWEDCDCCHGEGVVQLKRP